MRRQSWFIAFATRCAAVCAAFFSPSANAQAVDLTKIQPECGSTLFEFKGGACVGRTVELGKVTGPEGCPQPHLEWDASAKKCNVKSAPQPSCGSALANLVVKEGRCFVDSQVARSAAGDYHGDCFKVIATPDPNPHGLVAGQRYEVEWQDDQNGDRLLTVALAGMPVPYFCSSKGGVTRKIPASEFQKVGAERLGWTYGLLTLPFKYYPHDKGLSGSGALGPYVGRRSGSAGSGITFAGTAAIGSVKGEVTDAQGNVTNPDLVALSLAVGWMYDISKRPGAKPFKVGFFVGKDIVGAEDSVKYDRNRRTWIAFQIGFDFTDN